VTRNFPLHCTASIALSLWVPKREGNRASRAFAEVRDLAAVVARDLSNQRKAETKAGIAWWARAGRAIERCEDTLALRLGHAGAIVLDGEQNGVARPPQAARPGG